MENFPKICDHIQNTVKNRRNSVYILYGPKGVGRKSSVRWAVHEVTPFPYLIEIDAMICCEENSFVQQFINQINKFTD